VQEREQECCKLEALKELTLDNFALLYPVMRLPQSMMWQGGEHDRQEEQTRANCRVGECSTLGVLADVAAGLRKAAAPSHDAFLGGIQRNKKYIPGFTKERCCTLGVSADLLLDLLSPVMVDNLGLELRGLNPEP